MLCTICSHTCCMLWLIAVYVVWVTWEIVAAFLSTDHSMAWSSYMYLDEEVPPPWKPNSNENITFTIRGDNNGPLSLKSWPYYPSEDAYILYISHAVLCTICSHACCMLWLIAVYVLGVTWEIAATFLNTDHSMACIWLNVEVPPLGSQIAKMPEWKIQQGISPSTPIINRHHHPPPPPLNHTHTQSPMDNMFCFAIRIVTYNIKVSHFIRQL